jgi:hypothetical protein
MLLVTAPMSTTPISMTSEFRNAWQPDAAGERVTRGAGPGVCLPTAAVSPPADRAVFGDDLGLGVEGTIPDSLLKVGGTFETSGLV